MLATDLFSWGSLADVLDFVDPAEREAALPALLDEAEIADHLRAQSAPLFEYLTHREVMSALVSTALGGDSRVSEIDDHNAADDRADASRRRRNVACEVLCSDSAPIAEAVTATDRGGLSVHLPRIEACLRNHAPGTLPRHVASTIEKLIMSLLRTKPCSLLNWLAEPATRRGMVEAVVAHLAVPSISHFVDAVCLLNPGTHLRVPWQDDPYMLDALLTASGGGSKDDAATHATRILVHAASRGLPTSPFLEGLLSNRRLELLADLLPAAASTAVMVAVLRRSLSAVDRSAMIAHLIPRLFRIVGVIKGYNQQEGPFGAQRLGSLRLLAALIALRSAEADQALDTADAYGAIVDTLFVLEHHSVAHLVALGALLAVLESDEAGRGRIQGRLVHGDEFRRPLPVRIVQAESAATASQNAALRVLAQAIVHRTVAEIESVVATGFSGTPYAGQWREYVLGPLATSLAAGCTPIFDCPPRFDEPLGGANGGDSEVLPPVGFRTAAVGQMSLGAVLARRAGAENPQEEG